VSKAVIGAGEDRKSQSNWPETPRFNDCANESICKERIQAVLAGRLKKTCNATPARSNPNIELA
jgi:hypothetical protein